MYTVAPYFDTKIEYMNFKNNPDDISLLWKIIFFWGRGEITYRSGFQGPRSGAA